MQTINKKLKLFLLGLLAVLALFAIFLVISSLWSKNEVDKAAGEMTLLDIQKQYEEINEKLFVVSGEFVCLPLKNENVPHNDLCAFGIKNNEDYYRLQSMSEDKFNVLAQLKVGQNVEIGGTVIDEKSEIYKTLGTIEVRSVKVLDTQNINNDDLPASFRADYISFQNYNVSIFKAEEYPKLESWVENGEIECDETPLESSLPIRTNKKEISGQRYCISAFSEGAAGSVFAQYAYTTVIGENVYVVRFIARYPNCDNYPEAENLKCKAERERFNLDILVHQEIQKLIAPIGDAISRVTKKPFGIYITPQASPVSPEKFSGYHTGVDFEIRENEQNLDVAIFAICDGPLLIKNNISGYGGVAVQSCEINTQPVTVLYGHLDLSSINKNQGENLLAGDRIGILGESYSPETSGERKHLHLGVSKGRDINYVGYVEAKSDLEKWLNPISLLE